jgi:hypothetical protein
MPRKRPKLTQDQLDERIRHAIRGRQVAVEDLLSASAAVQKYLLSDGSILKRNGPSTTACSGSRLAED